MLYRKLGSTGEDVSILGFGCMRLPTIGGDEARIDEKAATRLLHTAIERGVNLVDNAYPYHSGHSEPWLGEALKDGYRRRVLLSTKLPSWKIETKGDFDRYLDEQLERLRTDHFDLYLLHSLKGSYWSRLRELDVLEFMRRAVGDGRIRYAGFSFHDDLPLFKEITDAFDWDFCLIMYNYMDEHYQAGTPGLLYAAEKGMGVLVMEPLRGGKLAGPVPEDIQALWDSARQKRSPAEWALRWVWNHPEVASALSGMNAIEQLEENLAIADSASPNSLTVEELALIDEVRRKYREREKIPCTVCDYCMPCPQGVSISKLLTIYNNVYILDDLKRALFYYNGVLDAGERADNCTACGECEEKCPQGIAIIEWLKTIHHELKKKPAET